MSVQIDLTNVPDDWETKWVTEIGRLKRNCFAAVFLRYFDFQEALENEKESEGALKRVSELVIFLLRDVFRSLTLWDLPFFVSQVIPLVIHRTNRTHANYRSYFCYSYLGC